MPTFQYRALTQVGEVVTGSLDATSLAEVNRRVEYLGLIPIEAATARNEAKFGGGALASLRLTGPRAEDVTIFTADLALLLHTGARINDALELLAGDAEMSRMRPTAAALASSILSGDSFGEAISKHPKIFPPIYIALIRIGETSGALVTVLEALAAERQRAEGAGAADQRRAALSRVPSVRRGRGSAVLPQLRPPPIREHISRLQRQARSGAGHISSTVGFYALERPDDCGGRRLSAFWPAGSFCGAGRRARRSFARLHVFRSCVRSWTTTAPASSAATSV